MIDLARNASLAAAQEVQGEFRDMLRRARFASGQPTQNGSFTLPVSRQLPNRKIYAFVDAWTALDANTWFWFLKSTVSALCNGVVVQSWPLEVGMLENSGTGFEEFLRTAFANNPVVPDAIRLNWANRTTHNPTVSAVVAPLNVTLDCDALRWDFGSLNRAVVAGQTVTQARIYLACQSQKA